MTNIYLISKHILYSMFIKSSIILNLSGQRQFILRPSASSDSDPLSRIWKLHAYWTARYVSLVVLGPVYTSIVFTHFFHGSLHFLHGTVWLVNGSVLFVKDIVRLLHGTVFFLHETLLFVFSVYTWKHVSGSVFYHWANFYYGQKCLCS